MQIIPKLYTAGAMCLSQNISTFTKYVKDSFVLRKNTLVSVKETKILMSKIENNSHLKIQNDWLDLIKNEFIFNKFE